MFLPQDSLILRSMVIPENDKFTTFTYLNILLNDELLGLAFTNYFI